MTHTLTQTETGIYYFEEDLRDNMHTWTIYTKDADCKRGDFAEEIDVRTSKRSVAAAKKVAQAALERDYEPGLRISRVVNRVELFM